MQALPENCEWSEWQIGECSKSCNGGIRTNTRTKKKEALNGGVCEGGETMEETCNAESCPGYSMFLNDIYKSQNNFLNIDVKDHMLFA